MNIIIGRENKRVLKYIKRIELNSQPFMFVRLNYKAI